MHAMVSMFIYVASTFEEKLQVTVVGSSGELSSECKRYKININAQY